MPRTAARVLLVLTLAAASAWGSVVKATEQPKDAIIELQEIVEKVRPAARLRQDQPVAKRNVPDNLASDVRVA